MLHDSLMASTRAQVLYTGQKFPIGKNAPYGNRSPIQRPELKFIICYLQSQSVMTLYPASALFAPQKWVLTPIDNWHTKPTFWSRQGPKDAVTRLATADTIVATVLCGTAGPADKQQCLIRDTRLPRQAPAGSHYICRSKPSFQPQFESRFGIAISVYAGFRPLV